MSVKNSTYLELTRSIYCPTCQGQVLEESNTPIAKQMKTDIIAMLQKGNSPEEIKMHFATIYGEKVLTEPTFEPHTFALWFIPIFASIIAIKAILRRMRFEVHKN